ncbi:hypothetical protein C7413_113157 [Paraburkholderia silvatlantica]|nr:hypothetical protein C7411_11354 [Paraburkholderia silvatlantica]PXW36964.1 hypothetical protein C7413_113157 [Paraburkholderia silvatlantica]
MTVRDAMRVLRVHIRDAQTKGYSLEQIAEQARGAGIGIAAGTIRYALRAAGRGGGAGHAARTANRAPAQSPETTLKDEGQKANRNPRQ